jgi:hypothetical protein
MSRSRIIQRSALAETRARERQIDKPFRLRVFARGGLYNPLPREQQDCVFDETVRGHFGTVAEWAPNAGNAKDLTDFAFVVTDRGLSAGDAMGRFWWSEPGTDYITLLGIAIDLRQTEDRELFGYRVAIEALP